MIDCRTLSFSPEIGASRRLKAERTLGKRVVMKILGLALYWLGAKRPEIARTLGVAENSLRTTVRVVTRDGVGALEDRRRGHVEKVAPPPPRSPKVVMNRREDVIIVRFGEEGPELILPCSDSIQLRVVVLSLLQSELISTKDAAEALGFSSVHARNLLARLAKGGAEALLDKRGGSRRDHVLTPEVKSEIVLQYSANAVTGGSTLSADVAADLDKRCGIVVSDRTLRHCVSKLGLKKLRTTLPELVDRIKKGSLT